MSYKQEQSFPMRHNAFLDARKKLHLFLLCCYPCPLIFLVVAQTLSIARASLTMRFFSLPVYLFDNELAQIPRRCIPLRRQFLSKAHLVS